MPLTSMIRKLNAFSQMSKDDMMFLTSEVRDLRVLGADVEVIAEGERQTAAYVLVDGWTLCYKTLADGRRQIINFAVPGDFLGFRAVMLNAADHSIATMSTASLYPMSRDVMREIFGNRPHLAMTFLWSMAREEAIIVEHLINAGRRTAMEGLAHLLVELLYRLRLVGFAEDNTFACAITQQELADALGLSVVHVNRLLRQLRDSDIVTFRDRKVIVHDVAGLAALVGYDPSYLDQPPVGILAD